MNFKKQKKYLKNTNTFIFILFISNLTCWKNSCPAGWMRSFPIDRDSLKEKIYNKKENSIKNLLRKIYLI
uniref:Uncharacterized protein n=1 Tax=Megaselia scalaris TaxID=36166 RepID=T1GGC5_MEGSC